MAAPQLVDAEIPEDTKPKVAKPKSVKKPEESVASESVASEVKVESNGSGAESTDSDGLNATEVVPDPMTFVFTPLVGDDRTDILLPLDFSKPDFNNPLDRIWLFDLGDLPPHERMWVWLRRAAVSRMTAHRVVALPLDEQVRCIESWLSAAQGVGAGE